MTGKGNSSSKHNADSSNIKFKAGDSGFRKALRKVTES